ncbi:hypothetical protein APA_243 [Pseudanabaena sp. lw0831]|nr:hypothetical protein APA_243 [Pseudanabaena sp. lw0831]
MFLSNFHSKNQRLRCSKNKINSKTRIAAFLYVCRFVTLAKEVIN